MGATDLASLLGVTDDYVAFNREERNYAALLYHYIMSSGAAMERFLQLAAPGVVCERDYPHTYFEYAHVRDMWEHARQRKTRPVEERNALYFNAITKLLESDHPIGVQAALEEAVGCSISGTPAPIGMLAPSNDGKGVPAVHPAFVAAFNQKLVAGRPSIDQLQSPGRWSAIKLAELKNQKLAKSACRLKWAFNAKADLVIHTGPKTAVCVEIKVDSKTSAYTMASPTAFRMSQLGLQQYILESVLGLDTYFVLLGTSAAAPEPLPDDPIRRKQIQSLKWSEVFEAVLGTDFLCSTAQSPRFADRTLALICKDRAK